MKQRLGLLCIGIISFLHAMEQSSFKPSQKEASSLSLNTIHVPFSISILPTQNNSAANIHDNNYNNNIDPTTSLNGDIDEDALEIRFTSSEDEDIEKTDKDFSKEIDTIIQNYRNFIKNNSYVAEYLTNDLFKKRNNPHENFLEESLYDLYQESFEDFSYTNYYQKTQALLTADEKAMIEESCQTIFDIHFKPLLKIYSSIYPLINEHRLVLNNQKFNERLLNRSLFFSSKDSITPAIKQFFLSCINNSPKYKKGICLLQEEEKQCLDRLLVQWVNQHTTTLYKTVFTKRLTQREKNHKHLYYTVRYICDPFLQSFTSPAINALKELLLISPSIDSFNTRKILLKNHIIECIKLLPNYRKKISSSTQESLYFLDRCIDEEVTLYIELLTKSGAFEKLFTKDPHSKKKYNSLLPPTFFKTDKQKSKELPLLYSLQKSPIN